VRTLFAVLALVFTFTNAAQPSPEARIDALVAQMTLEEKLGQLSQYVPDQPELGPALDKGLVGSMLNGGDAARINELQRRALAGSRLKIPVLFGHDVIHGYRTTFPIPLAIAATWDPELAELSSRIAAREARAAGIHWTFAPMVDIARDPRWGRIAEGAGEDPFLGSAMAAAYVRGFRSGGLMATAKHFAAYGAAEGGRDYAGADMSEATLREIYLPPFKAAVDAGVESLMSAFNTVNGIPATAHRGLIQNVLRDEWGFRGFIVSDWSAVTELINHRVAATPRDAAILAITAGVDLDMWSRSYMELASAVREGRVPESVIDESVRRMLRAKIRAGLFEQPFTDEKRTPTVTLTPENRQAARRVAERAIVLLKNEGAILPLSADRKSIAVIGPLADSREDMLGPWAAEGRAEDVTTLVAGLRATAPKDVRIESVSSVDMARHADVIVAALGENRDMSGEAASRSSIELPTWQQTLLEELVATGKPVVLVVMSGRPLAISWAAQRVPAILQAWFLGTESGFALADVLFGRVNPSGKLPVTIPRNTGQVPVYHSLLPSGRPADPANKFTSKYIDLPLGELYPFGHGLSYTRFEYSDLRLSAPSMKADGHITASVSVRNAGDRGGEEVVQLYVTDPVATVSRPLRELKGFRRIALKSGESKRVEFPLGAEHLRYWLSGGWVVEPGTFIVRVAGLEKSFEVEGGSPPMSPRKTGFLDRWVREGAAAYPYVVYVPRDYDPAKKWPVILFLHGAGERGNDGLRPTAVGLGNAIRFGPERIPAIAVFPQAPSEERWLGAPADAAMRALDATVAEFHGDPDRVYVTGLSMGGYGAWHFGLAYPDRFAAMAVICGGLLPHPTTTSVRVSPLVPKDEPYAFVAEKLRGVPIWMFHGADDTVIPVEESRRMAAALEKRGADVRYTEYAGVGHNSWDAAYGTGELWTWMFAQKR
jgi:beta-glucosidase